MGDLRTVQAFYRAKQYWNNSLCLVRMQILAPWASASGRVQANSLAEFHGQEQKRLPGGFGGWGQF